MNSTWFGLIQLFAAVKVLILCSFFQFFDGHFDLLAPINLLLRTHYLIIIKQIYYQPNHFVINMINFSLVWIFCDYQMKIYSQIKSQDDPPSQQSPNRQPHFSFNRSIQDMPRSQLSDSSSQNNRKKFSFKLQPELYFQSNKSQQNAIFQTTSHIRVASSSSQQEQKAPQPSRSYLNRKKIFDKAMSVTVLNEEAPQPTILVNNKPIAAPQQEPKKVQVGPIGEVKPASILKRHLQPQQPGANVNNSSFQSNRSRSRKNLNRVQFVHEDTDKYISQPILQDPIKPQLNQSRKEISTVKANLAIQNPDIMQRVLKNEQQLKELNAKLDRKIAEDNQRNQYFKRLLTENTQQTHRKQTQTKELQKQMDKFAHQKECQRERINLEIKQTKRLQELILQNRHLCNKVLQQQQSQKQKEEASAQQLQIDRRIKELQQMRKRLQQNRSLDQTSSLHLNHSLPLPSSLNSTIQQQPAKQQKIQNQRTNPTIGAIQRNQKPTVPTFQMIPQRDVPAVNNPIQIKRIVLVSKIY